MYVIVGFPPVPCLPSYQLLNTTADFMVAVFPSVHKKKKIDLLQSAVRLDLIYSYGQVIDVTKY